MRSTLHLFILTMLLALGGVATAQETTDATEDDAAAGAPADLSLGEPIGPQIGQPYVLQEFGDWEMRCVKAPEGQSDPCNLYQLLENDEGVAVAEFNLFRLPPGARAAAGATIVV
ncbi:MAG: invasion associated locus B family protein, partial [Pseudomonadota bacterium]